MKERKRMCVRVNSACLCEAHIVVCVCVCICACVLWCVVVCCGVLQCFENSYFGGLREKAKRERKKERARTCMHARARKKECVYVCEQRECVQTHILVPFGKGLKVHASHPCMFMVAVWCSVVQYGAVC